MRRLFGRAVGALLVALLAMSIIGVAATETFVNKTGHDVYGITVTFSTRVKITRHGYVFPDQDPASGRSEQFTFSGGKLHNYQRFTIGWIPGTAQVVDYEWLEEEPTASSEVEETAPPQETSSSSASSLPDPNTPPLLYGDDYPGPDEPLYQPKPDEEIWLTDLEGHEDIYDNDGIRINYAPGFDKSKVTKINVYRNGVYMRFLPEKFDVLTNAQMKTFDGNPMEHSPASGHTDHAIMGYEYEFDIYTTDHLWILKKTVKSGFRWRPEDIYAFLDGNWTASMERLTYPEIITFFNKLKSDGFTGIGFNVNYYVDSPTSNDIYALNTYDRRVSNWGERTASFDEIKTLLKAAMETKLNVNIVGKIYISKAYKTPWGGLIFGGALDPKDPNVFFKNYEKLMLPLAKLFEEYHVKSWNVFDEMDTLEEYSTLIHKLFSDINIIYSGHLGIDEATNLMMTGESYLSGEPPHQKTFKEIAGRCWDWIDRQGRYMNRAYSCWAIPMETQKDQRASVMPGKFVQFWKPALDFYHQLFPHNPDMFGEQGEYNADGVCLGGQYYWHTKDPKIFDDQEMGDVWYGYLKGDYDLGVNHIVIWSIPLGNLWANENPPGDLFINFGSTAYRVITAIIKPDE